MSDFEGFACLQRDPFREERSELFGCLDAYSFAFGSFVPDLVAARIFAFMLSLDQNRIPLLWIVLLSCLLLDDV